MLRLLARLDVEEHDKRRRRSLVYLARYGRTPLLAWEDTPVDEVLAWVQAVSEMVQDENELAAAED